MIELGGMIELGTDRIRKLLASLDNPQDKYKVIHVAGTNGKGTFISESYLLGSVCAFITSILSLNMRIGRFNSPFLHTPNDAISINGVPIPPLEYTRLKQHISDIAPSDNQPSQFELTTCVAFLYFHQSGVDVAVIECGMGGLRDATNVISRPLACIFTSIGLDHQSFLGDTAVEIATEKSGIIKRY
jgi:dihydrofolate synthase/folylpolyglutamate synthase